MKPETVKYKRKKRIRNCIKCEAIICSYSYAVLCKSCSHTKESDLQINNVPKDKKDFRWYRNVHMWLFKYGVKKGFCEFCKKQKKTQFALKKGEFYRKDMEVFIELCPSCHAKYDDNLEKRRNKSLAHIGLKSPWSMVPISCSNGKNYPSISDAVKELSITNSAISNCLKGRTKKAGGFVFKYV